MHADVWLEGPGTDRPAPESPASGRFRQPDRFAPERADEQGCEQSIALVAGDREADGRARVYGVIDAAGVDAGCARENENNESALAGWLDGGISRDSGRRGAGAGSDGAS